MSHRLKAILKTILAIVCFLLGLLLTASIVSVLISRLLYESFDAGTAVGFGVAGTIFLGVSVLLFVAAWRLHKAAQKHRALLPASNLSFPVRVILAVACFLMAAFLVLVEVGFLDDTASFSSAFNMAPGEAGDYNRGTAVGSWLVILLALLLICWLVRTGYRLLRHSHKKKEVIELLGEEF
ncbi:hypothetical protein HGH93_24455 [Chitinophaga polysaccharea]|uniref:hypothetical protein n=1 Tax=Chitinophaga TaxID=79328 RepID=UPI001455753F|nr:MULTISPECIES: hypothetical protein [Chitinophaga]NLR61277.1 hypothetical protein [Chitinophaga polysaccharea]NLU95113.1 hypothetical protein [Chitinophaga sp. Ak27]